LPYHPHVTVARAGSPRGEPAFLSCVARLQGGAFGRTRVERVTLYESELGHGPPRYTSLAALPLRG
jgi:2'-5' RNA ligase